MNTLHNDTPSHPYAYRLDSDGCDDTWDVYDTRTGDVIASIPFWDLASEWSDRAEARAKLLVALFNMRNSLRAMLRTSGDIHRQATAVEPQRRS